MKRVVGSTEIRVIRPIDTTDKGPEVPDGDKGWQPVHLRQGTMDGACGLYSLMMGLIICGVVRHEEARAIYPALLRSKIRKLFDYFWKLGPLVKLGTNLDQMLTAIDEHCPEKIDYQGLKCKDTDLIEFIDNHIKNHHPVLLILNFKGGRHWVLAIGRECENRGKEKPLCRFLILDPSEDTPMICSWNGVIDVREQGGKYPYRWWSTHSRAVQLVYAVAIWPKKHK